MSQLRTPTDKPVPFEEVPCVPVASIVRFVGTSQSHGQRRYSSLVASGAITKPHSTVTGRKMLIPADAMAFYESLVEWDLHNEPRKKVYDPTTEGADHA